MLPPKCFSREDVILNEVKDLKNMRKKRCLTLAPSGINRWFAMLGMTAHQGQQLYCSLIYYVSDFKPA